MIHVFAELRPDYYHAKKCFARVNYILVRQIAKCFSVDERAFCISFAVKINLNRVIIQLYTVVFTKICDAPLSEAILLSHSHLG